MVEDSGSVICRLLQTNSLFLHTLGTYYCVRGQGLSWTSYFTRKVQWGAGRMTLHMVSMRITSYSFSFRRAKVTNSTGVKPFCNTNWWQWRRSMFITVEVDGGGEEGQLLWHWSRALEVSTVGSSWLYWERLWLFVCFLSVYFCLWFFMIPPPPTPTKSVVF